MLNESIFMLPDEVVSSDKSTILPLRNPSTNGTTYYLLCNKKLFEIQGFDEKYRSWFIDKNVYSDGCIKITTPYNPVFLILPYLMKATKNVPLDHLLQDEEYPSMVTLSEIVDDLHCVADRKGPENLGVWCYNEASTLNWLSKKVEKLADALEEARERPSMTLSFSSDKDAYRVLAFGILSDCLCEELIKKLRQHLKLPEPEKDILPKTDERQNKKSKFDGANVPEEADPKPKKVVAKQTAKDKALAKSAKGSKSIMNFFNKK